MTMAGQLRHQDIRKPFAKLRLTCCQNPQSSSSCHGTAEGLAQGHRTIVLVRSQVEERTILCVFGRV